MTNPAGELPDNKEEAHLLLRIFIKKVETSQEPETSREVPKKRSGRRKTMSRKGKKNSKKAAKCHRPRRSKKKASGALRGVRKTQRRRQKKHVSFITDKRPLPPFFLFMAKNRPNLQRSNPDLTAVEMAKTLGKMWHQQPQSDRDRYREQAEYLRKRKRRRRQ
ncbi:PREDICTED: high mobility group protein B2-like [Nestor notabilis]|uniref:high mobility group protein B2-like n=1 Tax=Nestor notabilis TaxID=176057 RepID=UPI0005238F67|nr:PREDICTED: high mobility group protein B2-like [Nestor notabilis]